jgi:sec-independent protein translocase protein TatB
MFGIGMTELIVIMVVALIVFGPTRLPELARSLGRAMSEFRRASTDIRQTFQEAVQEPKPAPAPVPPAPVIAPPEVQAQANAAAPSAPGASMAPADRDPSGATS